MHCCNTCKIPMYNYWISVGTDEDGKLSYCSECYNKLPEKPKSSILIWGRNGLRSLYGYKYPLEQSMVKHNIRSLVTTGNQPLWWFGERLQLKANKKHLVCKIWDKVKRFFDGL